MASEQLKRVLSPSQIETVGIFVASNLANARLNVQTERLTAQFKAKQPTK